MDPRRSLSLLLILAVIVPLAGAGTGLASHDPTDGTEPMDIARSVDDGRVAETDAANISRLYIDDRYKNLRLKPGETDSVTVTVENVDEGPVVIDPHLVRLDPRARPIPDDWVTVEAAPATLDPDEEVEVTVEVTVPEDAELGDYRTQLAFTDERIPYPGRPARPVHAMTVNVDVWRKPTVRVVSGGHTYTQIEAGETHTHEIVVENTGDRPVPLSPEFATERSRHYPRERSVDRSWFGVSAPNEIGAGERATVEVTITPPADAERGRYDAELDLGIKDPARDERDTYWQRIRLNFQVWEQPAEPFETEFEVDGDAADVELTLSPRTARYNGDADPVRFDVTFVSPNGSTIAAERVRVSDRGFVDLSADRNEPGASRDGDYAVRSNGQQFVYRVDDPAAGTWSVRVMPHNTVGFGYEIVRHEAP